MIILSCIVMVIGPHCDVWSRHKRPFIRFMTIVCQLEVRCWRYRLCVRTRANLSDENRKFKQQWRPKTILFDSIEMYFYVRLWRLRALVLGLFCCFCPAIRFVSHLAFSCTKIRFFRLQMPSFIDLFCNRPSTCVCINNRCCNEMNKCFTFIQVGWHFWD